MSVTGLKKTKETVINLVIPLRLLWTEIHLFFRDGTHASISLPRFLCCCFLSLLVPLACLCVSVVFFPAFLYPVGCLSIFFLNIFLIFMWFSTKVSQHCRVSGGFRFHVLLLCRIFVLSNPLFFQGYFCHALVYGQCMTKNTLKN